MARHHLTLKQFGILGMIMLCTPLGDACLARGMRQMPPITLDHPLQLIQAVFTPWIALGILLLIGFFSSYITALSWADLTFVYPATSFGNVVVALLARFWLHEQISVSRWAGIILITIGVTIVAQGPPRTAHTEEQAQ